MNLQEFRVLNSQELINEEIINLHINNYIKTGNKNKETDNTHKRLENKLYSNLNQESCINTVKYIFYKIRSGIFVKIENNELKAFIPFANKNFINNWHKNVKFYTESENNNLFNYIKTKKKYLHQYKKYIPNVKNYWANAFIINNEDYPEVWGQHSFKEYHDIITETLKSHDVSDCYFIINKRDHPTLNKDLYEPYQHMYPKNKFNFSPKIEHTYRFKNYIPILSPYTNRDYLDIPFIIPEDWKLAISDDSYYKINNEVKWEDKIQTALFRGSATGSMEIEYNQRLQISKLDTLWKLTKPDLLDAGIVSWNSRDKIDSKLQINYIKPSQMKKIGIELKKRIPMNEQIKYKYIINIDGHSSPNRTSYLLQMGSLILMVESKYVVGNVCWYTNLIKPYEHYIPIKYDLSDLESQIIWCIKHDKDCKKIVDNAKELYETHFNKKSILEYSAYLFNQISNNFT